MITFSRKLVAVGSFRALQRSVASSPTVYSKSNIKWRMLKGLSENPNTFGPLTNLPDYTFLDGRPTPLGQNLRKRLEKQAKYTESIMKLNKEIDTLLVDYQRKQRKIEEEKNQILNRKFQPKGKRRLE